MNVPFVWQRTIWRKLIDNIGSRTQALLFTGRKGIGKLTFARLLAKSLLCVHPDSDRFACGQCVSCNWFDQQSHPNFIMLLPDGVAAAYGWQSDQSSALNQTVDNDQFAMNRQPKKRAGQRIGIDQVRALDDFVYLTGHQTGYKIILIYTAEAMTVAAANALLKKLEEPPEKTLFILVSHRSQQVLPTIRSRCQQITMPVPDTETASQWLVEHWPDNSESKQKLPSQQLDRQDADKILALSGFAPLLALPLVKMSGLHQQFTEAISTRGRFDPLALSESMQHQDLHVIIDWLQKWCYDLASFQAAGCVRYHPHLVSHIQTLCRQLDQQACIAYLRFLNARQPLAQHPVNGRLFLEEIFIHYGELITSTSPVLDFSD